MAWATALLITASVLLVQATKYEFTIVENSGESHFVGQIVVSIVAGELR